MHLQYIKPTLGHLRISQISSMHLEKIISEMLKKGLTKASANKVIQHFKAVFNHAFNNEYIARNPSRNYKQLKLDFKEMEYLSQEEMDQLLSYTNQKYVGVDRWKHVMYLTLFLTGARLGEVLGLEWHRIQFATNTILIGGFGVRFPIKLSTRRKERKIELFL